MKYKIYDYLTSFKTYFPTWIICIFFFLWDNFICAIAGVGLLILQIIQIRFLKNKYVLISDEEIKINQIMENAEVEKKNLNKVISGKELEIEELKQGIDEEIEKSKKEHLNYISQLEQQVAILKEELDISYMHGEFVGFAGHYRVGVDIDTGSYLIIPHDGKDVIIELYSSYTKFKRDEESIFCIGTEREYRIALSENGAYLTIENGDVYRVNPIRFDKNREDYNSRYDIPILEED